MQQNLKTATIVIIIAACAYLLGILVTGPSLLCHSDEGTEFPIQNMVVDSEMMAQFFGTVSQDAYSGLQDKYRNLDGMSIATMKGLECDLCKYVLTQSVTDGNPEYAKEIKKLKKDINAVNFLKLPEKLWLTDSINADFVAMFGEENRLVKTCGVFAVYSPDSSCISTLVYYSPVDYLLYEYLGDIECDVLSILKQNSLE